ncbi:MAG: hypothetical protein QNJ08_02325 [Crocosphaera sp.]|nr:hypothetical protein [Crocosphaera sp.]
MPGVQGSSLAWLTPAAACALLGTHCSLPVKQRQPSGGAAVVYRKIRGLKPRRLRRIVREIYVRMSLVEIPDPLLRRLENSRGKAFREGRN